MLYFCSFVLFEFPAIVYGVVICLLCFVS